MDVRALQRNKQPFGQYWQLVPICFQNTLKTIKQNNVGAGVTVVSHARQASTSGFYLLGFLGPIPVGLVEEGGQEMKVRVPNQTILHPFFHRYSY